MIELEINADSREHKMKVAFNMSPRQIACIVIGLIPAIIIFMLLKNADMMIRAIVAFLPLIPAVMCGTMTVYGYPPEKYVFIAMKGMLSPVIRKYDKAENPYVNKAHNIRYSRSAKFKKSRKETAAGRQF